MIPTMLQQAQAAGSVPAPSPKRLFNQQKGEALAKRLESWPVGEIHSTITAHEILGYQYMENTREALGKLEDRGYLQANGYQKTPAGRMVRAYVRIV